MLWAAAQRRRWWIVAAWTTLLALRMNQANDWSLLRYAARALFAGDGLHLYARHPGLQIGAPALAVVKVLDRTGSDAVVHVVLALAGVAVLVLGEATVKATTGRTPDPRWSLAIGLLAGLGWMSLAGDWLHVEDALALLLLAAAILALARDRDLAAGLLIGLAVAVKPWAVIGLPLLLRTRAGTQRTQAAAAAVAVPVLFWAPFLLADHHTTRITHTPFPVKPATPVHLLHLASGNAPGWIRTAQLALAVGLALAVVIRRGTFGDAIAAGVTGRLLLDVADYPYYWSGLVLIAAYADLTAGGDGPRRPWRTALAVAGWAAPWAYLHGDALAATRLAILLVLAVAFVAGKRRDIPTASWPRGYRSDIVVG